MISFDVSERMDERKKKQSNWRAEKNDKNGFACNNWNLVTAPLKRAFYLRWIWCQLPANVKHGNTKSWENERKKSHSTDLNRRTSTWTITVYRIRGVEKRERKKRITVRYHFISCCKSHIIESFRAIRGRDMMLRPKWKQIVTVIVCQDEHK